jgi:hypothetical protein
LKNFKSAQFDYFDVLFRELSWLHHGGFFELGGLADDGLRRYAGSLNLLLE